jgi:hypothetical protein
MYPTTNPSNTAQNLNVLEPQSTIITPNSLSASTAFLNAHHLRGAVAVEYVYRLSGDYIETDDTEEDIVLDNDLNSIPEFAIPRFRSENLSIEGAQTIE